MFGTVRAEILHSWGHSRLRTQCWMHTLRGNGKNKAKLLSESQLPFWRPSAPFPQASRGSMKFQQVTCMWTQPNRRPCIYLGKYWGGFLYPIFIILLYLRLKHIHTNTSIARALWPHTHAQKRELTHTDSLRYTLVTASPQPRISQSWEHLFIPVHSHHLSHTHMDTHGGVSHVVTHLRISDILHKVSPLFSWWGTYALPVLLFLQPWVSLRPSGCRTYTVRRKQREAKISPRALSPWTLQLASFILSNPRPTSHTKHHRYVCWDPGELNAMYNLVYCQFLALSNLSLQEVLRIRCPSLQGFLGGPYKHQSWVNKYSHPKLKERDAGPEYQEGQGIPRHACRTLLCPQLITPRHSLVFCLSPSNHLCPQGSQSPTQIQPASTLTHSSYLQEAELIRSITLPWVCLCHSDLGFSKLCLWNPDNPIATQYADYQEAENLP